MADSISLEQLQEQHGQLSQTVSNLVAQKATLEDQLEGCKATLASNQGALQYAVALIQSLEEDNNPNTIGEGNVSEDISVPEPETDEEVVL
jgi:chaperonin cofactor prefoldin